MKKSYCLWSLLLGLLFLQLGWAQQKTISGTVNDENGLPLPGATVVIEGTTQGVATDFDGNFSINANTGDILVISYVGYADQRISIGNQDTYTATLTPDNALEEVVVTALGQTKEVKKLGYSAQAVDTQELANSGENNIVNSLNGKVAGINIISSSGAAGSSANIFIRGASSVLGNNQPLFVIDGIPIDNSTDPSNESGTVDGKATFKDYGKVVGSNRASDLNPEDIQSLTVLKGGAATALYGIRAVNGAVIITTKSGKGADRGLNVSFSSETLFDEVNKYPSFTEKYARGRGGNYSNVTHWSWGPAYADNPTFPAGTTLDIDGDGTSEDVGGQAIPLYRNNYKNFFQTGLRLNNNISISKSTDAGNFYLSFGNVDQESIIQNNTYDKINFNLKGEFKVNEKLSIGGLANYSNVDTVSFEGGDTGFGSGLTYFHHMWDLANRPWIDSNSERTWFSAFVPDPNWIVNEEGELGEVNRLIGNVNASYHFTDAFKLNFRTGIDTF